MSRNSRIRWNAEERAAIVRRAQTLVAQTPGLSHTALFKESQDCLPSERRREPFSNAVTWLKLELKKAGPLPGPVNVWRPESSGEASGDRDAAAAAAPAASIGAASDAAPSAPRLPSLDDVVEMGVHLVTRILADARVRDAVSQLLRPAAVPDSPMASAPATSADAPAPGSPRGEFVVVAGCSAAEAKSLAKEVDGTLEVRFWSNDEPRERLLELLPRADVVIGVTEGIPKAMESSLARLGERYVRHTGNVKGLYRRLAEHAMR